MSDQICRGSDCERKTAGANLCVKCSETLAIALINVAAYWDDMATVEAKATRYASNTASLSRGSKDDDPDDDEVTADWQQGAPENPLPVDARFLDVAGDGTQVKWDVWNSVTTWCRVILEEAGPQRLGPNCHNACLHTSCAMNRRLKYPRNTVRSMVAYFDRQFRFITKADWTAEFLDEMLDNENRMRRLIDRPADRWYAGKCGVADEYGECTAELYAMAGNGTITCPACGIDHNVSERREYLLKEAEGQLVTATQAANALIAWTDYAGSETKLVDRIRRWRDRDDLKVQDVTSLNGRDRHLYRLGDVQTLLFGAARRDSKQDVVSA